MTTELAKDIYYVGVADAGLKVFDIIMETEYGTTYNAYLVKGEKSALVETVHDKSLDEYISNIEQIMPVSEIDYVICNHTEPDHSGSLVKILELNPEIQVVGTTAALRNLKEITNRTFHEVLAKDGETLDLGNGLVLKFIIAPNLHWPDTMMTYLEARKTLFSCDVLGAHYYEPTVTDEGIQNYANYEKALKVYYDCIVSPFNEFVIKGLQKLQGLDIQMVCNSHGPVLKKYISEGLEKYSQWSKPHVNEKKTAAIFYVSAYGYTEKLAETIREELLKQGLAVHFYNVIESDPAEMMEKLHTADALLFGSPTINRNALKPIWDTISSMDLINMRNKPVMVFGSYGWSGEGTQLLEQHLTAMRLKVFEKPFTCVFKPTEEKLEELRQYTSRFAESF